VAKYIQGCATCQQFKVQTHPQRPSLVPIESLSLRLFGQVGIDFMTDLPMSEDFDSIMVVVDHGLSKGVILTPCNKTGLTTAKTVRLYIDNVYSRFGLSDKMISDCGPQFDSAFWKEMCTTLQIKHAMTTAFHPQTNGGTEHVNREVQTYLSIFCINNPTSWVSVLKKAEFVYNNRPHADRTQSLLNFGMVKLHEQSLKHSLIIIPISTNAYEYSTNGEKTHLSPMNTLDKR